MPLLFLRVAFVLVAIGIATLLIGTLLNEGDPAWFPWIIFLGTLGLAAFVIAADILLPRKPIDVISAVYFGLLVGVALTSILMLVLTPLLLSKAGALNHVAIFTAIAFWSWAWGASGMLLAVPMLMVFKAVCDHVEGLHPIADLLGTGDEPDGSTATRPLATPAPGPSPR